MQKVQLIVERELASCAWFEPGKKVGESVWVDEAAARHLLENGICGWPKGPVQLPTDGKKPLRRSDGWPVDRFSVIDRLWEGETAICIGGGPSLTQEDLELTRRSRVIAINDAYLIAPWADICYFADAQWWKWHTDGIKKSWPWASFTAEQQRESFKTFAGQKVTIDATGRMIPAPEVFMLHNDSMDRQDTGGLSERPNALRTGSNSGYQSVNLAVLAGAKRILLLGYDMKFSGGRTHSHNGHPTKGAEDSYTRWAKNFDSMRPHLHKLGVEVINCSPDSVITAFKRGDIASVLANPV